MPTQDSKFSLMFSVDSDVRPAGRRESRESVQPWGCMMSRRFIGPVNRVLVSDRDFFNDAAGQGYGGGYFHTIAVCSGRPKVLEPAGPQKWTLRVTRDCEIRMIEQIVAFRSQRNLRAFRHLEGLLQRHIKL